MAKELEHCVRVIIDYQSYKFYFHSLTLRNNFQRNMVKVLNEFNSALSKQYNLHCKFTLIPLMRYYEKIEKEGFKVSYNDIPLTRDMVTVSESIVINLEGMKNGEKETTEFKFN